MKFSDDWNHWCLERLLWETFPGTDSGNDAPNSCSWWSAPLVILARRKDPYEDTSATAETLPELREVRNKRKREKEKDSENSKVLKETKNKEEDEKAK